MDIERLFQRREEAIAGAVTTANVGAYPVPLGQMLRPPLYGVSMYLKKFKQDKPKKTKKKP